MHTLISGTTKNADYSRQSPLSRKRGFSEMEIFHQPRQRNALEPPIQSRRKECSYAKLATKGLISLRGSEVRLHGKLHDQSYDTGRRQGCGSFHDNADGSVGPKQILLRRL